MAKSKFQQELAKIQPKHAEQAFEYIRKHGDTGDNGIRYWRQSVRYWSVSYKDEQYAHAQVLRLAYLFALKDRGEIEEEPPFNRANKTNKFAKNIVGSAASSSWKKLGYPTKDDRGQADDADDQEQAIEEDAAPDESAPLQLLRQFRQIVFHGPPGTGKTRAAKQMLAELFEVEESEVPSLQGGDDGRWDIAQFHPSYNYEDFVRGVKVRTENNQVVYETVNRIFGEMCERARENRDTPYALIIDEINRANVSAVLGELIYALEYRGEKVRTPYKPDFVVPKNLFIIGTMNTADRTIGQIDYAVRRRFAFVHLAPNPEVVADGKPREFFDRVNALFDNSQFMSQDFEAGDLRIGHSYFLASGAKLGNKIIYQVVPILREYVRDGVLLPAAESVIAQIEEDAEELSTDKSRNYSSAHSREGQRFFYWKKDDRFGLGGVGRTVYGILKDFMTEPPQWLRTGRYSGGESFSSEELQNFVKFLGQYTSDNAPESDGRRKYFPEPIVGVGGSSVYVSNQVGAAHNAQLWDSFKEQAKEYDYAIGDCHLVNLGELGSDMTLDRTWEDCRKYNFVSAGGKQYLESIPNIKKGDLIFVKITRSADEHNGYVACAEVVSEEAVPISKFRTAEGLSLADCDVGGGLTYKQKYSSAFEGKYPDHAIRVRWIAAKRREDVITGISTSVRLFRVGKILLSDFRKLRAAFDLPKSW